MYSHLLLFGSSIPRTQIASRIGNEFIQARDADQNPSVY